jgi:hypothetical protein
VRTWRAGAGPLPAPLLDRGQLPPRATRAPRWVTLMERLLVVEHNRLFGEGLALLLEWRTGLSSTHAHALDEAKSVLEEADWKPACIIVDLDLPEGGRDRIAQGTGWDTGTGAHQEQKRGTPGRGDRTGSGRGATYDRVGREDSRSGGAAHRPLDLLLLGALMTQGALPLAASEDRTVLP